MTAHKVIASIGHCEFSVETVMDVRTAAGVIDDYGVVTVEGKTYLPEGQVDNEGAIRPSVYKVYKIEAATAAGAEAAQLRGWFWTAIRD